MLTYMDIRARSVAYAAEQMGHKRYGTWPNGTPRSYFYHLALVESVLLSVGFSLFIEEDHAILAAAWNHDTLEDTDVSYNDLRRSTTAEIADIVYDVTNGKGKTRHERHKTVVEGLLNNRAARILKLADRAANAFASRSTAGENSMYKKYQAEYAEFKGDLQRIDLVPGARLTAIEMKLWALLDELHQADD
jgi:(p)ppGpp synthase/HD superfamily hydrolase